MAKEEKIFGFKAKPFHNKSWYQSWSVCLKCLHRKLPYFHYQHQNTKPSDSVDSKDIKSLNPFAVCTPLMLIFKSIKSIKDCVENEKFMFEFNGDRTMNRDITKSKWERKSPICCENFQLPKWERILTKLNGRKTQKASEV